MDGCAFTLHAYANIKHGFAQTTIFSVHTSHRPHYCYPTTIRRYLDAKKHHRKCFSNTISSRTLFFPSLLFPLTLFLYLLVPKPISASFCLRWCRQPKINGRVTGNLITRHYEAEKLLWLQCNVTFSGTWNNGGAEGHPVRSISAQCNQSHTSSWSKNKHLDFRSIMWCSCFFVCAWVLMCT